MRSVPRLRLSVLAVPLLFLATEGLAQERARPDRPGDRPPARPADVESVDAIVAALYDVISGPAGEPRDWDRLRSLFVPGARLVPNGPRPDGTIVRRTWTVDEYIDEVGPQLVERGFHEREVGRSTERYGEIAHAFSAYESRWTPEDPEPFARGINSIQLLHDGERWWVLSILWRPETPDTPIPDRYLDPSDTDTEGSRRRP